MGRPATIEVRRVGFMRWEARSLGRYIVWCQASTRRAAVRMARSADDPREGAWTKVLGVDR